MQEVKKLIDELEKIIQKVIGENQVIPQVKSELEPSIKALQDSFPEFYNDIVNYYSTVGDVRRQAITNQLVSTFSCKDSFTLFSTSWNSISKTIDKYADVNPPPHIQEITVKFRSLKSTFDFIQTINERQKKPSQMVESGVLSIQTNCNNLYQNICSLFNSPTFPHFETDMCTSFKNDIKLFVSVISSVFANDFVITDHPSTEINKLKLGAIGYCNDMISILSASFSFTDQMKQVQDIKNEINKYLSPILQEMSGPFSIVKPLVPISNRPNHMEFNNSKQEQELTMAERAINMYSRFDDFLNRVLPSLVNGVKMDTEMETNLDTLEDAIKAMKVNNEFLNRKLNNANKNIKNLKDSLAEEKQLRQNNIDSAEMRMKARDEQIIQEKLKINDLEKVIQKLEEDKLEYEKELERFNVVGDPTYLRRMLCSVLDEYHMNYDSSDPGLNVALRELIQKIQICPNCPGKDKTINDLRNLIDKVVPDGQGSYSDKLYSIPVKIKSLNNIIEKHKKDDELLNEKLKQAYTQLTNKTIENMNNSDIANELHKAAAKKRQTKMALLTKKMPFAEKLTEICHRISAILDEDAELRLQFCTSTEHDTLFDQLEMVCHQQLNEVDQKLNNMKQKIEKQEKDYQQLFDKFAKFKKDLSDAFKVEETDSMIQSCVMKGHEWKQPYIDQKNVAMREQKHAEVRVSTIYQRVTGILNIKGDNSLSCEDKFDAIQEMLDTLQDDNEKLKYKYKKEKEAHDDLRLAIVDVCDEYRMMTKVELIDPKVAPDKDIVSNTAEVLRRINPRSN
ncbi:hypothetical protein TVAG_367510 [Trichomonas vaginalis G3]|uniref:Uncharacterized protein n=1 Tax=Trichomonas vaginalis (strain ATCC PRA-98 / G3) TaxID=412133 RepID=A2F5Q8_TRIV3|nr:hypothetical protein TVAGG3_0977410 [Trichomonas vaginalis G3]EAX99758.1 hypothetical protein TVAG_367510 [Trichomonas vaginalis G3]KAI5489042.1 hypothetical protein TVAGG3_0977410 [Trichomonas vaginalis G3]|eukprot:XP_001312688.1 hypothetical protein [Trichomonas vaginalis G3]